MFYKKNTKSTYIEQDGTSFLSLTFNVKEKLKLHTLCSKYINLNQ